jgi:hypothetical protein
VLNSNSFRQTGAFFASNFISFSSIDQWESLINLEYENCPYIIRNEAAVNYDKLNSYSSNFSNDSKRLSNNGKRKIDETDDPTNELISPK